MKFRAINKIYGKLKVKCFEMPNASYTNRYNIILKRYEKAIYINFRLE